MKRTIGTSAYGLRAPIVKQGDDLAKIVVDAYLSAKEEVGFKTAPMDVLAITESLVARAQGNYCTIEDIATDLQSKFDDTIGVVFPILSRNRFSVLFKSIVLTGKKIKLFLNYPSDEVGNSLMDKELVLEHKIDYYNDTFTEKEYRELTGETYPHPFTGVDYINLYKEIAGDAQLEILLTNSPEAVLSHCDELLIANIHDRASLKKYFKDNGAKHVYALDDIMTQPIENSGYNPEFGLYGSNLSTPTSVKLFPRDAQSFVEDIQSKIKELTGVEIEVMVYGDGAFKDPVGKIWELADPVVSPGFTKNLLGTPNELKIKYIADTELADLAGEDAMNAMKKRITEKGSNLSAKAESLGTTPRQLTDLLGSLCDLMSGSGDKGTPIIYIQGYFDNYASE